MNNLICFFTLIFVPHLVALIKFAVARKAMAELLIMNAFLTVALATEYKMANVNYACIQQMHG